MKTLFTVLLLAGGLAAAGPAAAQAPRRHAAKAPAPPVARPVGKVYGPDEVTPCSFDLVTVQELLQSRAVYPAAFLKADPRGEIHVELVVDATGQVRDAVVRQPIGYAPPAPEAAAAVLAAARELPPLAPALRAGQPVALRVALAVRYPNPPPSKQYTSGTGRVYAYAEQMPQLPGGGGGAAIVAAIQQHLAYPAAARAAGVVGRVYVRFVVGADGRVRDAQVVQGLGHGCDEAALAAVRQLPEFRPGRQNGCPVAVAYTAPLLFGM